MRNFVSGALEKTMKILPLTQQICNTINKMKVVVYNVLQVFILSFQ